MAKPLEYGNLSDFLFDHGEQIKEDYLPRYARDGVGPEIDLLLAVMGAVRRLPGLDAPPFAPNRFESDIEAALAHYHSKRVPA